MANDDESLVIVDSILNCDIKTNDNLCMLAEIYNSLRTIVKRIASLNKNLREPLNISSRFVS
jgi:hypothetical protein